MRTDQLAEPHNLIQDFAKQLYILQFRWFCKRTAKVIIRLRSPIMIFAIHMCPKIYSTK